LVTGERRYSDRTIYGRVMVEARPYWGHISGIFLLNLLKTPLNLLAPLPLMIVVDNVISKSPLPSALAQRTPAWFPTSTEWLLVFAVALLVVVELLTQLQALATSLLNTYTRERLMLHFRALLFNHAQWLPFARHDRHGTTDAIYRIQHDAYAVPSIAVDGVIPFINSAIAFGTTVVVIAWIEPTLALIALVVAPALAALTWGYRGTLRVRHRQVKALESSALAIVQEVLTSLRLVKAFGQEDREQRRFLSRASEGMRARMRVALVDGSFWVAIIFVNALGAGFVLYFGVRSVLSGAITLGSLLVVMGYLAELYNPLYTMSRKVASLQSSLASAERAFALLDEERDVPERLDPRPLSRATGEVEFRNVSFSYEDTRLVLQGVSFKVEPGTRVGITGQTGSGKTTLISLLSRFYDPTSGAVLLDGADLRDFRVSDLRRQFAVVMQDPVLFSTTIGDNIAYGKPGATIDEIMAAAKTAGIHDFVASLPEKYDTAVGEKGMTLSGGERQRISLARAFLIDAPILILDEPTSSVDTKTETAIIDAMERLMEGRTTFIVAHRLSTLEKCNLRVHVENGIFTVVPARNDLDAADGALQVYSDGSGSEGHG
jgi:ATP-binding cassette subfamily B protein